MARKIDEILSESVNLSDDARAQINEAWEARISEAREEIAATLREEFARKFTHDKGVLVESIDRFLTDKVRAELEEFAEDKKNLVAERLNYKSKVKEHAEILNKFVTEGLQTEMKEFHQEKKAMKENFKKLENFLLKQLSEEITEFRSDKKSLVEQRVRMVSEGKTKLEETKQQFLSRAAKVIDETIEKVLRSEITQLKEDIKVARENHFGRKIFESVVAEYMTSYLNEGTAVSKLQKELAQKDAEMSQLKESVKKNSKIVEGLSVKLKGAQDLVERQVVMNELLSPLSKDKKEVMKELLESVQTGNLKNAYNKYLPSVLTEAVVRKPVTQLNESVRSEQRGDRVKVTLNESTDSELQSDIAEIKHLAGITKP
jgi:hypothetical protein